MDEWGAMDYRLLPAWKFESLLQVALGRNKKREQDNRKAEQDAKKMKR